MAPGRREHRRSALQPVRVIVVTGVSGAGKTAVGAALAQRLGLPFLDGDDVHSPNNIAKMQTGHPLEDADRTAWLEAIADWVDRRLASGTGGVVACSALKRAYRERLVCGRTGVRIVFLDGTRALIARRLRLRRGHFMPPSLLDSQFAALEQPGPDEDVLVVGIEAGPEEVAQAIAERL